MTRHSTIVRMLGGGLLQHAHVERQHKIVVDPVNQGWQIRLLYKAPHTRLKLNRKSTALVAHPPISRDARSVVATTRYMIMMMLAYRRYLGAAHHHTQVLSSTVTHNTHHTGGDERVKVTACSGTASHQGKGVQLDMDKQTDRQINKQTDKQTGRQSGR